MNSLNEIWESVIQVFRQKLTPTSVTTWFADCEPVDLVDNCLVLKTTTDFKRSVIEARFGRGVPVLIADFECSWYMVRATREANPDGQADAYIDACVRQGWVFEDLIQ